MSDIRTCIVAEDETLLRHALVAELKRAWPALQCRQRTASERCPDWALKPPKTTKLQGKSSLRMGAPPVFGKPLIAGFVALGTAVGGGAAWHTGPVTVLAANVTAPV